MDALGLGFAALREWIFDYAGEFRAEREVDALHVVATVLPLPRGRFLWKEPVLRRKSCFYNEGGRKVRAGRFEANFIEDAYADVRRGIAKKLTGAGLARILERCRKEHWAVVTDNSETALNARELAYVLWRMKFENLSEPAFVGMDEHRKGVFISDDELPFPYWNLAKPAWKILLWAAYRGYVHDVERLAENDGHRGDLFRGEATRHCCFLPSTDIRGRGMGVIAYPMSLGL